MYVCRRKDSSGHNEFTYNHTYLGERTPFLIFSLTILSIHMYSILFIITRCKHLKDLITLMKTEIINEEQAV